MLDPCTESCIESHSDLLAAWKRTHRFSQQMGAPVALLHLDDPGPRQESRQGRKREGDTSNG
jgi:hypothetical protein